MLTIIALTVLALITVGLVALAAKWLDCGVIGHFLFFTLCQSVLDGAVEVAGAVLSAATDN